MPARPILRNLGSIKLVRQPNGAFDGFGKLVQRSAGSQLNPELGARKLAEQAMNIPKIAQTPVQFTIGKEMRCAVTDHVGGGEGV